MSFFVSDSLKGIITEKDLEADSPIKIVEEETLSIYFLNDSIEGFSCELISMNFCKEQDVIRIATSQTALTNIF